MRHSKIGIGAFLLIASLSDNGVEGFISKPSSLQTDGCVREIPCRVGETWMGQSANTASSSSKSDPVQLGCELSKTVARKIRTKGFKNSSRERSLEKGLDPLISLNMNLDYLGKSGQKGAAQRAEELLLRIEALHGEGYYEVKPDAVSYNSVMNAYSISGDDNSSADVQRLLGRMEDLHGDNKNKAIKPTIVSFNTGTNPYTKNQLLISLFFTFLFDNC